MKRSKNFGIVEHDPEGIFPIRIATIHTRRGGGFWAMSVKSAKHLRNQINKAIERAEAKTEGSKPR